MGIRDIFNKENLDNIVNQTVNIKDGIVNQTVNIKNSVTSKINDVTDKIDSYNTLNEIEAYLDNLIANSTNEAEFALKMKNTFFNSVDKD